jgi:hypothetical protein
MPSLSGNVFLRPSASCEGHLNYPVQDERIPVMEATFIGLLRKGPYLTVLLQLKSPRYSFEVFLSCLF